MCCVSSHSASNEYIHSHTQASVQGWELARDVLEGYEDIMSAAPRRSANKGGELPRADHHNGLAQSKHSFTVHLLVIDIIAVDSRGAFRTSMCFTLTLYAYVRVKELGRPLLVTGTLGLAVACDSVSQTCADS